MSFFSAEQLQFFREHRYLVVPGLFGMEAMTRIRSWVDEVTSWPETPGGRHMVYYEEDRRVKGRRLLNRIENFVPHHQGLADLVKSRERLSMVSELLDEEAILFKDKINFKLPGGDGFKWHQDVQAGWDRYGSLHLTMMISVDEAHQQNGCLRMAHGYRGARLLGDTWSPLQIEDLDDYDIRDCPTRPGDAIFFDSFVPHGSEPNRSERPRRILYLTYGLACEGDQRARYFADKRRSYPPDIEREEGKSYAFRV